MADNLTNPPPVHGTARWANREDAAPLIDLKPRTTPLGSRTLLLGTLLEDQGNTAGAPVAVDTQLPLAASYPGHLLTVAGTGQGKSATQIIANLLTYRGSTVVIDPKGELYAATASTRRRFGKVFRLAPLAPAGQSDRYNPLDELDGPEHVGQPPGREFANRARRLAEMLIVREGNKGASDAAYWENEAINLLTAVTMFVVEITADPATRHCRTLDEVRRICTLPLLGNRETRQPGVEQYIDDVLIQMAQGSEIPFVRRQGGAFMGLEPKQLGSFLSQLNANLAFWDGHPGFAEVSAVSDFRFADLERETITVYLTIPLKDTVTSFRYLRAMVGLAFAALTEKQDAEHASVLFILDEFPALRDMEFMRDALAQMRSSGAWFWIFVQDLAQLETVYGRSSETFLAQTDHQVFFGGTVDAKTKKHISTALGVSTFAYRDPNISWSHATAASNGQNEQPTQLGGSNHGHSLTQTVTIAEPVTLTNRPLLTPFEVGTFLSGRAPGSTHANTAIILSKQAGGYPVMAWRRPWREVMATPASTTLARRA